MACYKRQTGLNLTETHYHIDCDSVKQAQDLGEKMTGKGEETRENKGFEAKPQFRRQPAMGDSKRQTDKPNPPITVSFEELAQHGFEVWIESGGQIYRLRRTRLGKLILTK
jgi:hemin uptake protein HemP